MSRSVVMPGTSRSKRGGRARPLVAAGGAIVVGALLAACGGGSSASSGGTGESVPEGATKEQYIDALADIEPITLKVQTPASKDAPESTKIVDWVNSISEWSGGKITFDIYYSASVAAPGEVNSAMADGLIDIGNFYPTLEPERFPVMDYAAQLGLVEDGTPLRGTLQSNYAWMDFGIAHPAFGEEMQAQGIQPLVPAHSTGLMGIFCKGEPVTDLASLKGKLVRIPTPQQREQVKALGATPVDIAALEVYDGLQRGTADCVVTPFSWAKLLGLLEVVDNVTMDPEAPFGVGQMSLGIGKRVWDDLPLPAQQLIWDRLPVFLEATDDQLVQETADAVALAEKEGVEFHQWEPDAAAALTEHNAAGLEQARTSAPEGIDGTTLVDDFTAAHEEWGQIITDELGEEDSSWEEFPTWLETSGYESSDLGTEVRTRILDEHRPGSGS